MNAIVKFRTDHYNFKKLLLNRVPNPTAKKLTITFGKNQFKQIIQNIQFVKYCWRNKKLLLHEIPCTFNRAYTIQ